MVKGADYRRAALRVLRLINSWESPPDGVILLADDDRALARRTGMVQARDESPLACPVAMGLAHVERENWVLAGFDPADDRERERLASLRTELAFDPCSSAERLDAKRDHQPRSAKRALNILTDNCRERESHCWLRAPLSRLRERGQAIGLTEFLDEIQSRLVPLFTATSS